MNHKKNSGKGLAMNAIRSDFELLEKVQSRRYVLRHLEHPQTPMCPEDSVLKNISIP
jgi:hypothetical protein